MQTIDENRMPYTHYYYNDTQLFLPVNFARGKLCIALVAILTLAGNFDGTCAMILRHV